jgi:hypothetical protein
VKARDREHRRSRQSLIEVALLLALAAEELPLS